METPSPSSSQFQDLSPLYGKELVMQILPERIFDGCNSIDEVIARLHEEIHHWEIRKQKSYLSRRLDYPYVFLKVKQEQT
jgi:hypothetical protein